MIKTKTKIVSSFVAALAGFAFFSFADAETLKIGFVTDWEYGKQKKYEQKLPKKATDYLKSAVTHYNKVFHPDLVIGGGDYVLARGTGKKTVAKQMRQINKVFQKAKAPRLYCIGNHDLSELSKGEVRQNLGTDYNHSATDKNGIRIITMDTNDTAPGEDEYETTGRVSGDELSWLEEKLDTGLPAVVFSHHSPVETKSGDSWRANIYDDEDLRGVLEKYGNVSGGFQRSQSGELRRGEKRDKLCRDQQSG